MGYEFFVGSYAAKEEESIYRYVLDEERQCFERIWAYTGAENPSFVLPHPNGKVLYSVEELNPDGRVAAYAITETGLERISSFPSEGADPCHLALDDRAEFLFAANYSSGSLSVFRLREDGSILELCEKKQHTGKSIDPDRQTEAHCHFSTYRDGCLYVCDLGEDTIYCYQLDRASGKLLETDKNIPVPAGYGPRHLVFGPDGTDMLYVVTEMGASLLVYKKGDDGAYHLMQDLSALPDGRTSDSLETAPPRAVGAAIKLSADNTRVQLSLRGMNAIAVFRIHSDGEADLIGTYPCGGQTPRDFTVFGEYLVAADQDSDQLALLLSDAQTGEIRETGVSERIKKPVCVMHV